MTLEELSKGEHATAEYKQNIPLEKEKFLKTAAAFANGEGGRLIFGVQDGTRKITGFAADEIFQKMDAITNSIYDSIEPHIVPVMEIAEIGGKQVISATIRAGMMKPYYLKKAGPEDGTYVRVAGVTRKAEPYEVQELRLEGLNRSFDSLRAPGNISAAAVNRECKRLYNKALELCRTEEQRQAQKKLTASQLLAWKVIGQDENGQYYPCNAWKLLTGDRDAFPDAVIQCAVFKGVSRNIFITRKEISGPADQQIEDALAFVKEHINLGSRIEGLYRQDFYELPLGSVREMIANAVCHRSYMSSGKIQVALFDDRLEVTSPGKLIEGLTKKQLLEGNSRIRNRALAAVFSYIHVIETRGSGIPRIFEDSADYGLKTPEITDFGTSFRISIFRRPFETDDCGVIDPAKKQRTSNKESFTDNSINKILKRNKQSAETGNKAFSAFSESQRGSLLSLLSEIKKDQTVTIRKLSDFTGLSKSTVERLLGLLKSSGIISREGATKKGTWIIHPLGS